MLLNEKKVFSEKKNYWCIIIISKCLKLINLKNACE